MRRHLLRVLQRAVIGVHATTIYGYLERARNAYLVILFRCYPNPYREESQ